MAGEFDDAIPPQERKELGEENLYHRLKQETELADVRSGLDSLQSHFSQADYYLKTLTDSGERPDVLIGDYGYMRSFENDYTLDRMFQALGVQDQEGQALSVDSLRNLATRSPDGNPRFKFEGTPGGSVTLDFFTGKDSTNFNCSLYGLSSEAKARLIENLESAPPKRWARNIVQQLSEQEGQIVNHAGQFTLSLFNGDSVSTADLAYFLDSYGFDPESEWTPEEVEAMLNGGEIAGSGRSPVEEWVDPTTQERWIRLPNRARPGMSLALRKQGAGLLGNILFDTDVLRGRDSDNKFLDSSTSREILSVFESLGLEPSDEMLNDFTEGSLGYGHYSDRYGNGYADLSRLVTYIARDGSGIDRLFKTSSPQLTPEKLAEQAVRVSAPAKLILNMMTAIMKRKTPNADAKFQIGDFSGRSIRDGSCKDSEVYFCGALQDGRSFREGLFICKSGYGSDTQINTETIVADGIEFPPGFLFRKGEEHKLEPLRATMYCFSNEEAKDAFGWQYEECKANSYRLQSAIDTFSNGWNIRTRS